MAESKLRAKKIDKVSIHEIDDKNVGSDISKENGYRRIPQKMAAVEIRDKFEFTIKISSTFRGKL